MKEGCNVSKSVVGDSSKNGRGATEYRCKGKAVSEYIHTQTKFFNISRGKNNNYTHIMVLLIDFSIWHACILISTDFFIFFSFFKEQILREADSNHHIMDSCIRISWSFLNTHVHIYLHAYSYLHIFIYVNITINVNYYTRIFSLLM